MDLNKKYQILTAEMQEKEILLKDLFDGKNKVLMFFYPKDNTPGCTKENKDFTDLKENFNTLGIKLVGVSKDAIPLHKKFMEKQFLKNDLISDITLELHKELGAFGEKNNYGKIVEGVIRSTFLFDENGELLNEWKNIKATGHAERLLKELSN